MFAITRPFLQNSTNPNLFFAIICTQLWKIYSSNCKKPFYKIIVSAFLKINCHMHYEFISSFSFWKFHWLTLISNWNHIQNYVPRKHPRWKLVENYYIDCTSNSPLYTVQLIYIHIYIHIHIYTYTHFGLSYKIWGF